MSEQGYDCLGEALAGVVGKHFLNLGDVLLEDGTRVAMRNAEQFGGELEYTLQDEVEVKVCTATKKVVLGECTVIE